MAGPLQARKRGNMPPDRNMQAGYTLTEVMIVVVIISILAAVSMPSFTRDSASRRGRDHANILAQALQRTRTDAMASRLVHTIRFCADSVTILRANPADPGNLVWVSTIPAPPDLAIWDAGPLIDPPGERNLTSPPSGCRDMEMNPLGNALDPFNRAAMLPWQIYLRNEGLQLNHPDRDFLINVTGLTGFVSLRAMQWSVTP